MGFQSTHSAGNATGHSGGHRDYQRRFQSTHSAGNATDPLQFEMSIQAISIHAFRRECDLSADVTFNYGDDFNPRIPQGMRPKLAGESETGS